MARLDVKHFLGIYRIRLGLFEQGITNPTPEGRELIQSIVDKLSKMPLTDEIIIKDSKMIDTEGNVIVEFSEKSNRTKSY